MGAIELSKLIKEYQKLEKPSQLLVKKSMWDGITEDEIKGITIKNALIDDENKVIQKENRKITRKKKRIINDIVDRIPKNISVSVDIDGVRYAVGYYILTGYGGPGEPFKRDVLKIKKGKYLWHLNDRSTGFSSDSCYIATASYGTPLAQEINVLRNFRDEKLLTNNLGKSLVSCYYKTSPPIAGFISNKDNLRKMFRGVITPIVKILNAGE